MRTLLLTLLCLFLLDSSAYAKVHHRHHYYHHHYHHKHHYRHYHRHHHHRIRRAIKRVEQRYHSFFDYEPSFPSFEPQTAYNALQGRGTVIGGRPSGCPYQFCGCGASLYLFHKIIPALNLAANWFRFPRTEPAPRMAAVRRHHVMVLVQHITGSIWLVHDSNSGGGKTRIHGRSIVGYKIVNPYG